MSTTPSWLWIPIVLLGSVAQTIRNVAQRSLVGEAGTVGATLARFCYGLPFTFAFVVVLQIFFGSPLEFPNFTLSYIAPLTIGALAQAAGTVLLLAAMQSANFVIAVTYSKTEVLQVAVGAAVILQEIPSRLSLAAMMVTVAGVLLLAVPKLSTLATRASTTLLSPAAILGLASGALFAIAIVAFRIAGLDLLNVGNYSVWYVGAWTVLLTQIIQVLLLGGWMGFRARSALTLVLQSWKVSLTAGMAGGVATLMGLTAVILRPAAEVRALSLIEVAFSYLVSRHMFREPSTSMEKTGLVLVCMGTFIICIVAS